MAVIAADNALVRSSIFSIGGKATDMGRPLRAGATRSIQRRSAVASPWSARSIHLRASFSASPSMSASIASVALLRDPAGRPFPNLLPGLKRPAPVTFSFLDGASNDRAFLVTRVLPTRHYLKVLPNLTMSIERDRFVTVYRTLALAAIRRPRDVATAQK
jgi:hypothetical protein